MRLMSACVGLVSTITNHPNLAPIRRVAHKGVVISVALQVMVPQPDIKGRKDILELYVGQIIAKDIDVDKLARMTTGFTGADLENMVNTAAIRAAIEERPHVTMQGNLKFRL